jgi:hypothetical protein
LVRVLDIFTGNKRFIEEHLLTFGLADQVLLPYLGSVPLIPVEAACL